MYPDNMRRTLRENWGLNKMEKKYTIFQFLMEIMIVFSVSILFITFVGTLIGEDSQSQSTLFLLGNKGLSNATIFEFFLFSIILEITRLFWISERILKRIMMLWRMIFMLSSIVIEVACFSQIFGWFHLTDFHAWIGFLVTFAFFFCMSILVMVTKTNMENKKVEEGLKNYRKERGFENNE